MKDRSSFNGVTASRKRPLLRNRETPDTMEPNMIRTATAAAIFLATGAGAAAAESYIVKFSYAPDASAEQIYASFQASADRTCAREMRRDGRTSLSVDHEMRNSCSAELVQSAVTSLGQPQVTALHRNKMLDGRGTELAQAE